MRKEKEEMKQEEVMKRFKGYYMTYIGRPGAAGLLEWMEKEGFLRRLQVKGITARILEGLQRIP